jgi:hypothetical protein
VAQKFILTGPQGIGKSIEAERIIAALNLSGFYDDWDGASDFPANSLAITTLPRADMVFDNSASILIVEDRKALLDLVAALERAAQTRAEVRGSDGGCGHGLERQPYARFATPCQCEQARRA